MPSSTLHRLRDIGETVARTDDDVRGRKILDSAGNKVGTVVGLLVDTGQHAVWRALELRDGAACGCSQHQPSGEPDDQ